jgi:hypothetical protein
MGIKTQDQVIKEFVVSTVSDDYEDFSMVLQVVSDRAKEKGVEVDREAILAALEGAIHEGYVQSYELSPPTPTPEWDWRPVVYSAERLNELRFYVTPEGKKLAWKSIAQNGS